MPGTLLLPTAPPEQLAAAVRTAVEHLRAGELVALPAETVYGLGADALNARAAARIFEAKERPFFDPLICHVADPEWLGKLAEIPSGNAELVSRLTRAFWPGPLTLVLPKRHLVPEIVTSGLTTVAIRMPQHPVFRAVLQAFERPIAAPSANRFGRISPTSAGHVLAELGGRIPLILDGGPTQHGLESTIVAVEPGETLRILRPGPVSGEDLSRFGQVIAQPASSATPEAPGQLPSHYAPRTRMLLTNPGILPPELPPRCALLAWRDEPPVPHPFAAVEVLSRAGDLTEAAASLFAKLRHLDELALDLIVCQRVPEHGLGVAIMDRLRKGAA